MTPEFQRAYEDLKEAAAENARAYQAEQRVEAIGARAQQIVDSFDVIPMTLLGGGGYDIDADVVQKQIADAITEAVIEEQRWWKDRATKDIREAVLAEREAIAQAIEKEGERTVELFQSGRYLPLITQLAGMVRRRTP